MFRRRTASPEETFAAGNDEPPKPVLYCSFCCKSQHEVRKLIAGPTVFICDECVWLCWEICSERDPLTDDQIAEAIGWTGALPHPATPSNTHTRTA